MPPKIKTIKRAKWHRPEDRWEWAGIWYRLSSPKRPMWHNGDCALVSGYLSADEKCEVGPLVRDDGGYCPWMTKRHSLRRIID